MFDGKYIDPSAFRHIGPGSFPPVIKYTVKEGDNLWGIAKSHLKGSPSNTKSDLKGSPSNTKSDLKGSPSNTDILRYAAQIFAANRSRSPMDANHLKPGQNLVIPDYDPTSKASVDALRKVELMKLDLKGTIIDKAMMESILKSLSGRTGINSCWFKASKNTNVKK